MHRSEQRGPQAVRDQAALPTLCRKPAGLSLRALRASARANFAALIFLRQSGMGCSGSGSAGRWPSLAIVVSLLVAVHFLYAICVTHRHSPEIWAEEDLA